MKSLAPLLSALPASLALAAALLAPAPLNAQDQPPAQSPADPYADLYAAMDTVTGSDQEFNRHYRFMMRELRQLPAFVAMERSDPGIVNAIGAAMRPWLRKHSDRMEQRNMPRVTALMKAELTPDEARKLAAYCRTERGRSFLLRQFAPERLYSDQPSGPARPRQPLGQPTAFLKPAEGYVPPAPKPAAQPDPAAAAPPDPAVAAILEDPEFQARLTSFFGKLEDLVIELGMAPADKDIQDGMFRDIDYAASTYGWRLFDRPLR